MATLSLHELPGEARLFVIALDRPATGSVAARLEAGLAEIFANWRHKGERYQAAWEVREGRLILVAEAAMAANPSGCAIDGMHRKVRGLASELGLDGLSEDRILVRLEGLLSDLPRGAIEAELRAGRLGPETPVLDLGLHNLAQLREGGLERPLARTWIGRKYKVGALAAR